MEGHQVKNALLSNMYWVDTNEIDAHRVRKYFTVEKETTVWGTRKRQKHEIPTYREGKGPLLGYLGLPITRGMDMFPAIDLEEDLSDGAPFDAWTTLPDPNHPMAADGQEEFMALTLDAVQDNYAALIKAQTGTGKTVVALNTAARLGVRTLVTMPLVRLQDQWAKQVVALLGIDPDKAGLVGGAKYQAQRQIVFACQKSLATKQYPDEFYRNFGFVIDDEAHKLGAAVASQAVGLFNSRYKLAQTATPVRKDGADKIYYDYYGRPAFERNMSAVPTEVVTLHYTAKKPVTGNNKTAKLIALAYDWDRNDIFVELAKAWYTNGNFPLFIMDHTRHVEILNKMFIAAGIPENHIGLYVGGLKEGTKKGSAVTKEYLDWSEKHARVFIATYGIMEMGIDIPKIDRGCDVSPRSEFEQTLGRIRRKMPGKDKAIWVTIRDRAVSSFEGNYFQRMKSIRGLDGITTRKGTLSDILQSP